MLSSRVNYAYVAKLRLDSSSFEPGDASCNVSICVHGRLLNDNADQCVPSHVGHIGHVVLCADDNNGESSTSYSEYSCMDNSYAYFCASHFTHSVSTVYR